MLTYNYYNYKFDFLIAHIRKFHDKVSRNDVYLSILHLLNCGLIMKTDIYIYINKIYLLHGRALLAAAPRDSVA